MVKNRWDQQSKAARHVDDKAQAATARREALAKHDSEADETDRRLMREAQERAKPLNDQMRKRGFGDHKGVEGF